jgi:hypothetical protein
MSKQKVLNAIAAGDIATYQWFMLLIKLPTVFNVMQL